MAAGSCTRGGAAFETSIERLDDDRNIDGLLAQAHVQDNSSPAVARIRPASIETASLMLSADPAVSSSIELEFIAADSQQKRLDVRRIEPLIDVEQRQVAAEAAGQRTGGEPWFGHATFLRGIASAPALGSFGFDVAANRTCNNRDLCQGIHRAHVAQGGPAGGNWVCRFQSSEPSQSLAPPCRS